MRYDFFYKNKKSVQIKGFMSLEWLMIIAVTLIFVKIIMNIIKWIKGIFLMKSLLLIINSHDTLHQQNICIYNIHINLENEKIKIKCKHEEQAKYIFNQLETHCRNKYKLERKDMHLELTQIY